MNENTDENTDAAVKNVDDRPSGFPRWKLALLSLAGLLVVSGLGLKAWDGLFGGGGESDVASSKRALDPERERATGAGQTGFLPGREPNVVVTLPEEAPRETKDVEDSDRSLRDWSPALITGGLSFFVGFCIGLAVRSFIKVSAIVLGLVFVSIFALSYFGMLHINWETVEEYYAVVAKKIGEEAESFRSFVTGSLPSAGMAGIGLFTGFKRK